MYIRELEELLNQLVEAPSQVNRKMVIEKISRTFYHICLRHGMEPGEIITLASEIIGTFNEDINYLKEKKEHKS